MSKRAAIVLFYAYLLLIWLSDRAGAWEYLGIGRADKLVARSVLLAAGFLYAHLFIFRLDLEARESAGSRWRILLAIVWGSLVLSLVGGTRGLTLDVFLLFCVGTMSAPIALVAPRGFKGSAWLMLYGILGLYVSAGPPAAEATLPSRLAAAAIHAMLIATGVSRIIRVVDVRRGAP